MPDIDIWSAASDADLDHCTFVNPLCPSDLCVLEYGHTLSTRGHHLTGTMYGSAYTSREEQEEIVCQTSYLWTCGYLAPQGTPTEELIKLGWKEARRLDLTDRRSR